MRIGEDRANILVGDLDAGLQSSTGGEPAPAKADEAAWQREREQREREQRERDGRS